LQQFYASKYLHVNGILKIALPLQDGAWGSVRPLASAGIGKYSKKLVGRTIFPFLKRHQRYGLADALIATRE
jgi:hypothetical protein